MGDLVQIIVEYLQKWMDYTDVYPVFDRYHPYIYMDSKIIWEC